MKDLRIIAGTDAGTSAEYPQEQFNALSYLQSIYRNHARSCPRAPIRKPQARSDRPRR